jgi:hypothetical protein
MRVLQRLAKGANLLFLMALFVGFNAFLYSVAGRQMARLGLEDVRLLDLHPGFTPDDAWQLLDRLGPEGRAVYQMAELTLDMIYPVIYSLLLAALLVFFFNKVLPPNCPCRRWTLLPFAGAVFDVFENSGIALMIQRFPERSDALASITSVFGLLKWATIALSILFVIAALIAFLFQKKK